MILVDTSVWIEHLRRGEDGLPELLEEGKVAVHPFVIGELACGNISNRSEVLSLLHALPAASRADDAEVLLFIDRRSLMDRGLGWVDVHLLAACQLDSLALWTNDARLQAAAEELGLRNGRQCS